MAISDQNELWDYEPTETSEEDEPDNITYQIANYPADYTLKVYFDKWKDGQIVVPPFQRNYVWDRVQASKLIESFLLGLPVPGVFLYKERETNKLLIIDGQQRILSAVRFFQNEFDEKPFRLKNVNPRWEGKSYEDLSESEQYQLNDTVLRATVVQQLDPADDSSIYYIFERLNTGGMKLNPMEIRKCVYYSEYYDILTRLNERESWRDILGKPEVDRRLRDIELILRILALSACWHEYEKPMKQFLNNFMAKKENSSKTEVEFEKKYTEPSVANTFDFVNENLGSKPFHIRGRLNYAVLDSVFSTLLNAKAFPENLQDRYRSMLDDQEYIRTATINTSDEATLKNRFELAKKHLVD